MNDDVDLLIGRVEESGDFIMLMMDVGYRYAKMKKLSIIYRGEEVFLSIYKMVKNDNILISIRDKIKYNKIIKHESVDIEELYEVVIKAIKEELQEVC